MMASTQTSTGADEVERIVVRGRRLVRYPLAPPPQDTVELAGRDVGFETLGDVVEDLPGLSLFRTGGLGASQFLSIRGADFDQTVVLIDDVPISGPDRGAVDLSLLPVDGFERVELFRGSAPIRYGMGAVGGVLRLVPRQALSSRGLGRLSAGSFGTVEGRAEVEAPLGPAGVVVSAGGLSSDNRFPYTDDNATVAQPDDDVERVRENAELRQAHGFATLSAESGPHRLVLLLLGLGQQRGLPGPSTVRSLDSDQTRNRFFGALGYRFDDAWAGLPVQAFLTGSFGFDEEYTQDPFGRIGLGREDAHDQYLSVDVRGGGFLELGAFGLGATAFVRSDDIRPSNRFATPGDQPSQRTTLIGAAELSYADTVLGVDLLARASASVQASMARIARRRPDAVDVTEADTVDPNLRFELLAQPTARLRIRGSVSTGTKLPTTLQLFGNRNTVVASPDLVSERSLSADVGLRYGFREGSFGFDAELSGFALHIENLIVGRRTAVGTLAFRNERSGDNLGVEAALKLGLGPSLDYDGALSLLDAGLQSDGFDLDQPLRVPLRLHQQLSWRFPVEGLQWWASVDYRSGFPTDLTNQVSQADLTLVDVGVRGRSPDGLVISASVRDLFDARGLDLLRFPRPGRSFHIGFEWRFSPRGP